MITTVTLNPSVDRRYMIDGFTAGKGYRTARYEASAGGKGLNVARVAHSLGAEVMATGLLGGKSGEFIEDKLATLGMQHQFLHINGETRTCIAILSGENDQTEILEAGPEIGNHEVDGFLELYESILDQSSIIVGSGSMMKGMPGNLYGVLIEKARYKSIPFLLDTSGSSLVEAMKFHPTFIKPNLQEIEGIIGRSIKTESEILKAVKTVADDGIDTVMVSLGERGAIVLHQGDSYRVQIPKVPVMNPVGSGDSTVAGFAVGLEREYGFHDSIRFAMSCGIANAMEEGTGHVNQTMVEQLMKEVKIELI